MSKHIAVICLFLMSLSSYNAQNPFEQDAVLKNIKSQLPEGWTAETRDKRVVFLRIDSIWGKKVNHTVTPNTKKQSNEEKIASFKKEGHKTRTMLSYRLDTRWSPDAIKKAEDQNRKLFHQVAKLPAKFRIEALFDSLRSEKGGEFYTGKTEADKEQIRKYEEEKARLMKAVVQVPFLQSEKFSLFPDLSSGYEDAATDIYPEQASFEWFKVQAMVTDLCKLKKH
jgi:hypothetical protein